MKIDLRRIFVRRKGSGSAGASFAGGVVAGIITAIPALLMLLFNKERFVEELAASMAKFPVPLPESTNGS